MKDKESFAKVEKLFNEIIANQQSVYDMVSALYERMDKLEATLSDKSEEDNNGDAFFATIAGDDGEDDLYEDAKQAVIEAGKASTSYLQRRLRIGYTRAARLMDLLEERGVIGPQDGAQPREVLVSPEESDGSEEGESVESPFVKFTKEDLEDEDELYEKAKQVAIKNGKVSTSFLQQKLKVGYSRSARLMDLLEERGVIELSDGSGRMRKVIEEE